MASYSNFRYYSEMLSSGALEPSLAVALQDFREHNGGCLSGMTRYTDHLDDMPAIGVETDVVLFLRFFLMKHNHLLFNGGV